MKNQSSKNPWQTHSTKVVYDNTWIQVSESLVTNPGGGDGIYGVVHFKNRAIGVIPIDDQDHTWLVGQFRYPTNTYEWEIPEGGCPSEEMPMDAARRELKEETGLVASNYEILIDGMALSNSVSTELATVFVASNLSQFEAEPEESEELCVRRLPLEEAVQMVIDGVITDAISVAGLLKLALVRHRNAAVEGT